MGVRLDGPKLQFPPLPGEWKDRYVPGQMFKYQASLPKLPVPPLQQTLHKYIASVEVCQTIRPSLDPRPFFLFRGREREKRAWYTLSVHVPKVLEYFP